MVFPYHGFMRLLETKPEDSHAHVFEAREQAVRIVKDTWDRMGGEISFREDEHDYILAAEAKIKEIIDAV